MTDDDVVTVSTWAREQRELIEAEQWVRNNRDRIAAEANDGNANAVAVVRIHRMLVRHSDAPTWAFFIAAVNEYRAAIAKAEQD